MLAAPPAVIEHPCAELKPSACKTRHTRREDLRQESQQENLKYQITPSTQRTPLPVYLSVRDEAGAIKRHELKSVPADKLF